MIGHRVVLVGALVLVGAIAPTAQEQKPADAAPPAAATKAPDLEEQFKTLQGQLAALAQRLPQPSAQDQTSRAKAIYADVFSTAKAQAGPACKAAGGHLIVTVDLQANRATVACEWR